MLDENDVYDRRIIRDYPKMSAIMRAAFNVSKMMYWGGRIIYWILMIACLLIVGAIIYQSMFSSASPLIGETPLIPLVLWTIIVAALVRWVIPFLFTAAVRVWYYRTRIKW